MRLLAANVIVKYVNKSLFNLFLKIKQLCLFRKFIWIS